MAIPGAIVVDTGMGAQDKTSPRSPVRQTSAPIDTPISSRPKPRNVRNLTLPAPISPSASSQTHRFQSLGESANNIASSSRPSTPLFTIPGTPLLRPTTPGTPLLNRTTPLSPTTNLPASGSTTQTTKASKLKALLPRSHNEAHSYFHARIEIQQLASVPFVRGEFGVRWKMMGYVGIGGVKGNDEGREESIGILGKMKGRSHGKGKAKDDGHGANEFGMAHAPGIGSSPSLISEASTTHSNSVSSYSTESYTSMGSSSTGKTKLAPSGNLSRNFFSPPTGSPATSPNGLGANGYLFTTNPKAYEESLLFSPTQQQTFSSNAADPLVSPGLAGALSPTGTITQANAAAHDLRDGLSAARGITPYLPLKDHSITFSYPLNAILKFDIAKNSNHQGKPKPNLQPNELKLVIMQRVIPDDPDGVPQNPRLGAVYLNLAEYVGKGKVERRYLLKDSRVNATLKLSIEMTYVSGNTDYVAPPLPKAEIMGGLEGFLAQNDMLKQSTKEIYGYTYGPYGDKEELEVDLLGRTGGEANGLDDEAAAAQDQINGIPGARPWTNMNASDKDPYALPSESESEADEPVSEAAKARKAFLRQLSYPPLTTKPETPQQPQPRRQDTLQSKEAAKAKRRETRREEQRERFKVDLANNPYALPSDTESEAETEAEAFESAPEDDRPRRSETIDSDLNRYNPPPKKAPNGKQEKPVGDLEIAAFDVSRLPFAYGPKTTEALIDSLFNPSLTLQKDRESPFTVFVDRDEWYSMPGEEQEELLVRFGGQKFKNGVPATAAGANAQKKPPPALQMNNRSYSTTSTNTSESGSGGSGGMPDEELLGKLRSPGEATIVGVPVQSNGRVAGLGIDGVLGVPMDRDRDATIGRRHEKGAGGVGAKLTQYYKAKKEKLKEAKKNRIGRGRQSTEDSYGADTTSASEDGHGQTMRAMPNGVRPAEASPNVLGSPVYHDEPVEFSSEHTRSATASTTDSALTSASRTTNSSSGSLSSLSLNSRSGHGHGGCVPSVPALIPGSVPVAAAAIAANCPDSPTKSFPPTSTGSPTRPLTRQNTAASRDLSVPPGRMDKTGMVNGANGLSSSINRWFKGFGGSTSSVNTAGPGAATPQRVAAAS